MATEYPMTCVIIDATEIFVQQPHLTELQQLMSEEHRNVGKIKIIFLARETVCTKNYNSN